ncbi:MAG: hypothetical protein WA744_00165, partial [Candidatus Acidiferrales bacterium]
AEGVAVARTAEVAEAEDTRAEALEVVARMLVARAQRLEAADPTRAALALAAAITAAGIGGIHFTAGRPGAGEARPQPQVAPQTPDRDLTILLRETILGRSRQRPRDMHRQP